MVKCVEVRTGTSLSTVNETLARWLSTTETDLTVPIRTPAARTLSPGSRSVASVNWAW